ncbi:MAG: hypothetical protein AAGF59_02570 [Pseudomonadota bacterium]
MPLFISVLAIFIACIPVYLIYFPLQAGEETDPPFVDTESADDVSVAQLLGGRSQTIQVPEQGVELGYGWDSRYGTAISNQCIDFAPVSQTGQTTNVRLTEVSDKSEIMESLGVSASVSVKTMFGNGGGAKASFARRSKVSTSNETLLLNATVLNGSVFTGPPRPVEPARSAYPVVDAGSMGHSPVRGDEPDATGSGVLLKPWAARMAAEDHGHFRKTCGDSYLASIDTGASLVATFTITSSNSKQASEAKAAIKANYGPVKASAEASKTNSSAISTAKTEIEVIQIGGSGGTLPTTMESLQLKLEQLASEAASAPIFQTMEVRTYDGLANWPAGVTLTTGEDDAETVADYYWFLASFYDAIEDVLQNPNDYSFQTGLIPEDLAELQDEVVQFRSAIRSTIGSITGLGKTEPEAETSLTLDLSGATKLELPSTLFARPTDEEEADRDPDQAYESFAEALREAAQFGSPSTLRLKLPLPATVAKSAADSGIDPRRAAVDHYVARQAKRMCRLEPTDNECLTNTELRALEDAVPVNTLKRPDRSMLQNIGDGTCLHVPPDGKGLYSIPCSEADGNKGARFAGVKGFKGTFGPADSGHCVFWEARGVAAPLCKSISGHGLGNTRWAFESRGMEIKLGANCLVSSGAGLRTTTKPCADLAKGQAAHHKWRLLASSGE